MHYKTLIKKKRDMQPKYCVKVERVSDLTMPPRAYGYKGRPREVI